MILPLRILMFLLMLAIAYFIFRWNKNNSGKKRWYALAIVFALASFGALGDTPEARHQEAIESSKAESSSIKESERKESISMQNLQVKRKQKLVPLKLSNRLLNHLLNQVPIKFQGNMFLL